MKKLFLILVLPIIFIGCLEPSPEKLDANWVKSVKGKSFVSPDDDNTLFLVFDDSANLSLEADVGEDLGANIAETLVEDFLVDFKFHRSIDKNKAIYEVKYFFQTGFIGFYIDNEELYTYGWFGSMSEIPDDVDWSEPTGMITLYKGK